MSVTVPAFTPIQETLFLTLCGRALDNHLPSPILGDRMAEQVVGRLGYDCGRFRLSPSPILNIALRAWKLDEVAQRFIGRHPNAVGLDLGPDWTPARGHRPRLAGRRAHRPAGGGRGRRPHGLLTQDDMIDLLNRLIGHFPSGEIAFNGYSRFAIWAARHYHGTQSVADLIRSPGFDDPHEPERWNPRLRLVKEILLTREPEVAEFPTALRLITRLAAHSTAWSRRGATVLHYRLQP